MSKRNKTPKLPKGWYPGDYDTHEYVIYKCGCSFHKVTSDGDGTARLKWGHCKVHKQRLDEAKKAMDQVWNDLMKETVVKSFRKRSEQTEVKTNGNGTPRLPSITEQKTA